MSRAWRGLTRIPTPVIFVTSIGLALLLLWREGSFGNVVDAARGANPATTAVGFVLYLVGLAFLCFRWHLLVLMTKGRSNLGRASEAFLTSVVINYAAPVGLAVPTRAALTKRALGLSAGETGAVAFWEIISDIAVLGTGTLVWLAISAGSAEAVAGTVGTNGVWLLVALVLGVLVTSGVVWKVPAVRAKVAKLASGAMEYPKTRPLVALSVLAVSAVYWIMQGVVLGLLLQAFGASTDAKVILGLISLPVLVGMLSPVPGGAGVREALMVAVADLQGAGHGSVLVAAVTYRVALFAAIPVLYIMVRLWLLAAKRGASEPTMSES